MPKKIVAIGGDGVGPEVVNAACYVLENMGLNSAAEILKKMAKKVNFQTSCKMC